LSRGRGNFLAGWKIGTQGSATPSAAATQARYGLRMLALTESALARFAICATASSPTAAARRLNCSPPAAMVASKALMLAHGFSIWEHST